MVQTLESMGDRCRPSYKECKPMEPLKKLLWQYNVPLALNGHDHSQQLVYNASGSTYFLTTGAGGRVTDPVLTSNSLLWPSGPNYSSREDFMSDNGVALCACKPCSFTIMPYETILVTCSHLGQKSCTH